MQQIIEKISRNRVARRDVADHSKSRSRGFIKGLVATSVAVLTLVLTPAVASAQSAVQLGSSAKIIAEGAAAYLPVAITCDPGIGSPTIGAQVTQRSGNAIAHGFGFTDQIVCNNTPQTIEIFVQAQNIPFRQGVAAVIANLTFCSETGPCQTVSDSGEIKFVK